MRCLAYKCLKFNIILIEVYSYKSSWQYANISWGNDLERKGVNELICNYFENICNITQKFSMNCCSCVTWVLIDYIFIYFTWLSSTYISWRIFDSPVVGNDCADVVETAMPNAVRLITWACQNNKNNSKHILQHSTVHACHVAPSQRKTSA